jgi:hypothetical protein
MFFTGKIVCSAADFRIITIDVFPHKTGFCSKQKIAVLSPRFIFAG